jgi:hypothetical protein
LHFVKFGCPIILPIVKQGRVGGVVPKVRKTQPRKTHTHPYILTRHFVLPSRLPIKKKV